MLGFCRLGPEPSSGGNAELVSRIKGFAYPVKQAFPQDEKLSDLYRVQEYGKIGDFLLVRLGVPHLEIEQLASCPGHIVLVGGDTRTKLARQRLPKPALLGFKSTAFHKVAADHFPHARCLLVSQSKFFLHPGGEAILDLLPKLAGATRLIWLGVLGLERERAHQKTAEHD